jgi:hypothetical protein
MHYIARAKRQPETFHVIRREKHPEPEPEQPEAVPEPARSETRISLRGEVAREFRLVGARVWRNDPMTRGTTAQKKRGAA